MWYIPHGNIHEINIEVSPLTLWLSYIAPLDGSGGVTMKDYPKCDTSTS